MGLDFDVIEFCRKLRLERPPPYECPVEKCDRNYKSICGMQYHLVNYDHDNPTPQVPVVTPARKKGRNSRPANKTSDLTKSPPKETLSYAESQKFVQFEMDGKVARIAIDDAIPLIGLDEFELLKGKSSLHLDIPDSVLSLPEPSFRVLPEYNICDAPPRPNAYIRFIEKSAEELDAEVEYDLDEEDTAWLQLMNEKRAEQGLNAVSIDSMELLMDRLEKESFFQATASGQSTAPVDDDAVCCICMDGECQNTNVILFCDMCNLAVHQDCYGVPYIPEGQWLCRRCLQSPSRPVDCVLCPNTGGAFKQTDRSQWAHVVCALWIPEVRFANTVFLEPIDSIESIPPARWKLSCYICKQRGVGACIQCNRNNCYAAFHVTCAQHAGLYMRMDQVNREIEGQPVLVQKTAFCDAHTPAGALDSLNRGNKSREESRQKMKQARRLLAKKRSTVPVVSIPTIPPEKVQEIASLVSVQKKPQFIQRLIAYWTLKRHYRNGVPLLRRLQSQGSGGARSLGEGAPDTAELCKQLKYWQCLRQDLERARLLCELVRKREKIKSAMTRVEERKLLIELFPLQASMGVLLQHLEAKDTSSIFCEPVDPTEVPDYSTVVTDPMDLSTMKMKLDNGLYDSVEAMEADFDLMIANCLAYNNKDTVFYKAGIKMRDQCAVVFKNAKKELKELGLIESSDTPVVSAEEMGVKEIDAELLDIMNSSMNTRIPKLEKLLEKAEKLKHGLARVKRVKNIRAELKNLRKNVITDSSQSDGEGIQTLSKIIKNSPIKETRTSPTAGVNRRTAVLFTRKAQAAFRKPNEIGQPSGGEENIETNDMQTREISNEIIPLSTNKEISPKETNNTTGKVRRGRKPKGKKNSSKGMDALQINDKRSEKVSESFLVYRGGQDAEVSESESEVSFSESTCSSCSHATDDSCGNYSHSSEWLSSNDEDAEGDPNAQTTDKPSLEPLQLVWAKCRGYPWYPALIMDPETPRGFVHNGVPLPHPPSDVLTLRDKKTPPDGEAVYLVLFFDAKRTWQWLPAGKLELLGVSKSTDQQKLVESRKPTDKKAVKKAYNDALLYQSQVTDTQGPGAIM